MSSKLYNDVDGAGATMSRKLEDRLSDKDGFRTSIISDGDTTTMLKTKGGRPEVTVTKKPAAKPATGVCVKSPLVEIAFKYALAANETTGVGPIGYRRWYGEPDAALPVNEENPNKVPQYEWSSDGLLCIQTRKIQKMRFLDANAQKVDLVLAKKPINPHDESDVENRQYDKTFTFEVAASGHEASAQAESRFRFVEGAYSQREWYPPEIVDVGWLVNQGGGAVTYLSQRLKKLNLRIADSSTPAVAKKSIVWTFVSPTVPAFSETTDFSGCANQNAREVSFAGRTFFATNGHMDKAKLRTGVNWKGKNIRLDFKRPGGFLSAVDPEGIAPPSGTPVTTHPGADKAVDLLDFKAFGNAYHGLVWWPNYASGGTPAFYKDSSRTDSWGFQPTIPFELQPEFFRFTYCNPYGLTPEHPNYVTTIRYNGVEQSERYYADAIFIWGKWNVKSSSEQNFSRLQFDEVLYKDPAGTVWVIRWEVEATWWVEPREGGGTNSGYKYDVVLKLRRRYGLIGTDFSFASEENFDITLGTTSVFPQRLPGNTQGDFYETRIKGSGDLRSAALGMYTMMRGGFEQAQELMAALIATFTGTGNLDPDAGAIGAGIAASLKSVAPPGVPYATTNTTIADVPSTTPSTRASSLLTCSNGNSLYDIDQVVTFATAPSTELVTNTIIWSYPLDVVNEGGDWKFVVFKTFCKLESHSVTHSITPGHISPTAVCVGGKPSVSYDYTEPLFTSEKIRQWSCTRSLLLNGDVLHSVTSNLRITTTVEKTISRDTNGEVLLGTAAVPDNPDTPAGWENTATIMNSGFVRGITTVPKTRGSSYWDFDYAGDLAFALIGKQSASPFITKLCFMRGVVDVAEDLLKPCHPETGGLSSTPVWGDIYASVGWAYDFRTSELITVPYKTLAYFV